MADKPELRQLVEMEDDMSLPRPNLTPAIGNPVYWIWWTIGVTLLVGILTLI